MKNLKRLVLGALLLVGFGSANAQDENNPWNITIGVNAIDVFPVNESAPQGDYFDEFFNANDHWSILPTLSTISVAKYLRNNISVQAKFSLNKITKWGELPGQPSVKVNDLDYYALDGNIRYHFGKVLGSKFIDPTIGVGGGYTYIEEGKYNTLSGATTTSDLVGAGTANASFGLKFNFSDNIGLVLESKYKHAFEDYLTSHFQHTAGLSVSFGGKDTDKDGVYDKNDLCPEVPGLKEFNGCPDTDSDGVEDSKDECPEVAGLIEFNGCPDTDGDGVSDNKDNCPNAAGEASLNGCPDSDKDGVADKDDKCPTEAGTIENKGCPFADSDNDGIYDKDDKCPKFAGDVAHNGCPETNLTDAEVIAKLDNYAKSILFNTGKSNFRNETYKVLTAVTAILKEYPNAQFVVEGNADSRGSNEFNEKLSQRRAEAVISYLTKNGIDENRLTPKALGETNPIDTNKTRAGRQNNRRVQVKLLN